jgi:hypothetical protein
MKRTLVVIMFLAGVLGGFLLAQFNATTVLAQRPWDCKSFNMDLNQDTAGAISTFLSNASAVELSSSGLSAGQRFAVVACRN